MSRYAKATASQLPNLSRSQKLDARERGFLGDYFKLAHYRFGTGC